MLWTLRPYKIESYKCFAVEFLFHAVCKTVVKKHCNVRILYRAHLLSSNFKRLVLAFSFTIESSSGGGASIGGWNRQLFGLIIENNTLFFSFDLSALSIRLKIFQITLLSSSFITNIRVFESPFNDFQVFPKLEAYSYFLLRQILGKWASEINIQFIVAARVTNRF